MVRAIIALAFLFTYCLGFYQGATRELSEPERRGIAIDYACSRGQSWRMMHFFCGSTPEGREIKGERRG